MENTLRQKAKELLERGEAKVVVGYGWNRRKTRTTPVFITRPEDTDKLVFNPLCVNNLSLYFTRRFPDIKALGRPAVVAKGCDIKTITVLISESQIKRDELVIIGVVCNGVVYKQELWKSGTDFKKWGQIGNLSPMPTKCHNCDVRNPHIADIVIDEKLGTDFQSVPIPDAPTGMVFDKIRELDKKSGAERWGFWIEHFNRCIKCYACRQICPLCYCDRCIADKNMPQWIEMSAHPRGNLAWNLKRAMDLVGRCTFCGECERACPVNIPLNLINQKMALVVKDTFGYRAGYDETVHPPMILFSPDDKEDFIG